MEFISETIQKKNQTTKYFYEERKPIEICHHIVRLHEFYHFLTIGNITSVRPDDACNLCNVHRGRRTVAL